MGFAKLVLGVLLVGLGVVLLAGHTGFLPPGTGGWLLRYWPIIVVAIGLALLANAIKNAVLGWIATLLIIGALAFGAWWAYHHSTETKSGITRSYDIVRPRAGTLTVRGRLFGGVMTVGPARAPSTPAASATAPRSGGRTVQVEVIGAGGHAEDGPRFRSSGGAAILEWPPEERPVYRAPLGAGLHVRAPDRFGIRLETKSLFSDLRADLARLRPERLDLNLMASRATMDVSGAARPSAITIHGTLSTVDLRIGKSVPVRLEFHAPLTFRSLPEDFMEHTGGRSRTKIWTSEGAGPPLLIQIHGPLIHLKIRREPLSAL